MHIVSVQSIAGGTGVTTICKEFIRDYPCDDEWVVALDFGHNQMLEHSISELGFESIGDVRSLFDPKARVWDRHIIDFPKRTLLRLPAGMSCTESLEERPLLDISDKDSLAGLHDIARQMLAMLSVRFEWYVADMSKAPRHLLRMMANCSNEVHFCERKGLQAAAWENFETEILGRAGARSGQTLIKQADRGNLSTTMH